MLERLVARALRAIAAALGEDRLLREKLPTPAPRIDSAWGTSYVDSANILFLACSPEVAGRALEALEAKLGAHYLSYHDDVFEPCIE